MSDDSDVCLLKNGARNESEVDFNVVEVKKRILITDNDKPNVPCPICEQNILAADMKVFAGPPDGAMEEEAALTNECLQLYDLDCPVPEVYNKPVHRLTEFSVFDGEGHLCEFDSGLIEKNKQIFCSGYIKPIYHEDPSPDGGVPAQEIGPIVLWWISGFDGGNNFLLALASPCAEYILMKPSEEYEPFMRKPRQKALLTKIIVEFLGNSCEPSYEEMLTRIQEVTVPDGVESFDEATLQRNAQFVVDQILEIDDDGDLISTPAMQTVIELHNVKINKRKSAKRKFSTGVTKEKLSKAAMTPLVSDIFENFFNSNTAYFTCEQTPEKRRLDFFTDPPINELSSYSWEEKNEFALVNGEIINRGDFVYISLRDNLDKIFRVEHFFQRNFTKQAHCTVYCSGLSTIIGESSDPFEFFYTGECGDWPICKILKKLQVTVFKSRFFEHRSKVNGMFAQKRYVESEGRYEDFDPNFHTCNKKKNEVDFVGGRQESDRIVYDKVVWEGQEYSPGCCAFVEPFAVTLDVQKSCRKIEKIVVTLKADERIYPEIYRKGKECDVGEECVEPFKIVYIKEIYRKQKKLFCWVNKFYRPEDTGLEKGSGLLDLHLIYWSDEEFELEFDHIRGRCNVQYSGFSRDTNYSNEFYFEECFDSVTRTVTPAKEVNLLGMSDVRKTKEVRKLRTMNVFCGSGGLAEGLQQSGVAEITWGIEIEESAAKAFKLNFPKAIVYQTDCNLILRNIINGKRDRNGLSYPQRGDVELMCGGPPCQGFSTMNRFTAKQYSQFKNSLIVTYLSFCDYYRPKYFILENVKNFVAFKKSSILKYTMGCLVAMGYQCSFAVLQAGNYGVPQNRKRLFIVASAPGFPLPLFPEPTHTFYSLRNLDVEIDGKKYGAFRSGTSSSAPLRPITIRDALHDLPSISKKATVGEMDCELTPYQRFMMNRDAVVRDHVCKEVSPLNEARIKHIPAAKGCDWRDLPNISVKLRDGTQTEILVYGYHDTKQGKSRSGLLRGVCPCASGKQCNPKLRQSNTLIPWCLPHTANRNNNWSGLFGRLDWDGYFSTTITNPEPSCKQGRVLHPEEDRVVSIRECARSQALPDSFRLCGTVNERYRQVGNSVPPPLARAIGYQIKLSIISSS